MGLSLTAARRPELAPACAHDARLEQAVVALHRDHSEGLFRFAMTVTRDRAMAEDAIQDAFLRYFVACREGQAIRNPVPWLYRVLRNRLLDQKRRASPEPLTGAGGPVLESDWTGSPEAAFRRQEASVSLRASLSRRELECLQLRLEGLNYREIAATLRIRTGTVGALLARALKKTRKVLGAERGDRC